MIPPRNRWARALEANRFLLQSWHLLAASRVANRNGHSLIRNLRFAPGTKRALAWVRANERATGGVGVHSRHPAAYAEVTGYLLPTLLDYGEVGLATRCARWLIGVQASDGSFADPDRGLPYVFDTGQALRGLLAAVAVMPEAAGAARRAADYLCSKATDGGRAGFDVRYLNTDPKSTHLYVLPPLFEAAEFFREPRFREIAERCLEHYVGLPDALSIDTLTHDLGYEIEALIDLGHGDRVMHVLNELRDLQRRDGSLRGIAGQEWVCSPGLAQIALCWYKAGMREPADRALAWLEAHQLWCGGFFGSYGPGASYFPNVVPAWAVKFYLDACRLRESSSNVHAAERQLTPGEQRR